MAHAIPAEKLRLSIRRVSHATHCLARAGLAEDFPVILSNDA